jgi:beta-galactosidase
LIIIGNLPKEKFQAQQPLFYDKHLRTLDVPHDWSIEGSYDRGNPSARGGGYFPTGIGWYSN